MAAACAMNAGTAAPVTTDVTASDGTAKASHRMPAAAHLTHLTHLARADNAVLAGVNKNAPLPRAAAPRVVATRMPSTHSTVTSMTAMTAVTDSNAMVVDAAKAAVTTATTAMASNLRRSSRNERGNPLADQTEVPSHGDNSGVGLAAYESDGDDEPIFKNVKKRVAVESSGALKACVLHYR